MQTIFVLMAFGGSYEDAWEHNMCAFTDRAVAESTAADFERWLDVIRSTAVPAELAEPSVEASEHWEDAEWENFWNFQQAQELVWRGNLLNELQVPEVHRQFLLENWEHSYDCDRPNYRIDELRLL